MLQVLAEVLVELVVDVFVVAVVVQALQELRQPRVVLELAVQE